VEYRWGGYRLGGECWKSGYRWGGFRWMEYRWGGFLWVDYRWGGFLWVEYRWGGGAWNTARDGNFAGGGRGAALGHAGAVWPASARARNADAAAAGEAVWGGIVNIDRYM